MHNKSFFQGLGLGIVIASVIFLILYSTRAKENIDVTEKNVQAEETETESSTSILDLPDKGEEKTEIATVNEIATVSEIGTISSEPLTIEQRKFTIDDNENGEFKTFDNNTESEKDAFKSSDDEENTRSDKSVPDEKTSDSGEIVHVSIKSGDTASDIYRELYRLGITEDENGFANYISKNNLSRKMMCGEFDIPKGAGYEEIYDIIKSH